MRIVITMLGAPGSGKSTFIEQNGLKPYTLAADDIRLLFRSPVLGVDGKFGVSQFNDGKVWNLLYSLAEDKMQNGELVVIDACFSKENDFTTLKHLAEKYRYRIYAVDFRDVDAERCKAQNKLRPEYKQVPEDVIDRMYARFVGQKPPKYVNIVKREDINKVLDNKIFDFDKYNKVIVFGDIHGCMEPVKEFFEKYPYDVSNYYIFVGDLFDRGIQNAEVAKWFFDFSTNSNILLLASNHGVHFNKWGFDLDDKIKSREFVNNTVKQFESAGFTKEMARAIIRKEGQYAHFDFHGCRYFVSHAGIPHTNLRLSQVATFDLTNGIGKYSDTDAISEVWNKTMPSNHYQLFGHRGPNVKDQVQLGNCFRLESEIEFGGHLTTVIINADNTHEIVRIKNNVYNKQISVPQEIPVKHYVPTDMTALIEKLRNMQKDITEVYENGISSFSFNRDVFTSGKWNDVNVIARGLFIKTDVDSPYIVARSYDKFFNIDEREETKMAALQKSIVYPLVAWDKSNGALGIIGFNAETKELVFTSKSRISSSHAGWLKAIFDSYGERAREIVYDYVANHNKCFVFEIIDPANDPHIIEYPGPQLVMLDCFDRTIETKKLSYEELNDISNATGIPVKVKCSVLNTYEEFVAYCDDVSKNDKTEGRVFEDASGFMFKLKTNYYKFVKKMRGVKDSMAKNRQIQTNKLYTLEENLLYSYMLNMSRQDFKYLEKDIITVVKEWIDHDTLPIVTKTLSSN